MDYSDHSFDKIKFKNPSDGLPDLTFEYTAFGADDTLKEAKDQFQELPHSEFRQAWRRLVPFWKNHIESVIGNVEWDLQDARVTTVKLSRVGDMISEVRYWVSCKAGEDTTVTIATPDAIPTEEERGVLREVCVAAVGFLNGAREQSSLFESDGISDERMN